MLVVAAAPGEELAGFAGAVESVSAGGGSMAPHWLHLLYFAGLLGGLLFVRECLLGIRGSELNLAALDAHEVLERGAEVGRARLFVVAALVRGVQVLSLVAFLEANADARGLAARRAVRSGLHCALRALLHLDAADAVLGVRCSSDGDII